MDYRQKYLKYKAKYVALKNMMGGELKDTLERINAEIKIDIKGDIYITCDLDVKEVINKKQQNITKKQTFKIFNLNQLKKEGTKFLCTDKSNNKIEIFKYILTVFPPSLPICDVLYNFKLFGHCLHCAPPIIFFNATYFALYFKYF